MQALFDMLQKLVGFFTGNLIAAAVLAVIIIVAAYRKPKFLFQLVALCAAGVAVLYIMLYLEGATFSGVDNRERAVDIERKSN